jgi:hypothetical protein
MSQGLPSRFGLSLNMQKAAINPVVDVAFSSISSAYGVASTFTYPVAILKLQNFTNEILDYSLDSGQTTTGHLAINEAYEIDFKSNRIPFAADGGICVKANSTLPSSGFFAITSFGIP